MILTIAHFKGGVGKTTCALHIAALLAGRGTTLVLDGDPNRSALKWRARATRPDALPFAIHDERHAARVAKDYEHVVIDTEARTSEEDLKTLAGGCDLLIIPTFADALSLDPIGDMVAQFEAIGARNYRVLLNNVAVVGRAGADARALLEEDGIPHFRTMIRGFAAYRAAANQGILVSQVRDRKAKEAWQDFVTLGKELP